MLRAASCDQINLRSSNLYEPKLMSKPCSRRADFKQPRSFFVFCVFFAVEVLGRLRVAQSGRTQRKLGAGRTASQGQLYRWQYTQTTKHWQNSASAESCLAPWQHGSTPEAPGRPARQDLRVSAGHVVGRPIGRPRDRGKPRLRGTVALPRPLGERLCDCSRAAFGFSPRQEPTYSSVAPRREYLTLATVG